MHVYFAGLSNDGYITSATSWCSMRLSFSSPAIQLVQISAPGLRATVLQLNGLLHGYSLTRARQRRPVLLALHRVLLEHILPLRHAIYVGYTVGAGHAAKAPGHAAAEELIQQTYNTSVQRSRRRGAPLALQSQEHTFLHASSCTPGQVPRRKLQRQTIPHQTAACAQVLYVLRHTLGRIDWP